MSASQRVSVGVIGTGRVGAVLGAALAAAGHHVVAATGVSADSRGRAARLLPGVPLLPADEVAARADLVLVAVPDDVLGPLVAGLAELGAWRPGQLVVHTSGAHGAAVLAPAAAGGARTIAAHPAMTFTGGPEDVGRLPGTTFGVTTEHLAEARGLVADLGGALVEVAEAARPLYHAALVVGANHLVTLVNEAAELLVRAGVAEPAAVLRPLLTAALDNALRDGDRALTGPVSRGDAGTVAGHLRVLGERAPDAVPGYAAMARLTAGRALAAGRITPTQAAPLLDVLATADAPTAPPAAPRRRTPVRPAPPAATEQAVLPRSTMHAATEPAPAGPRSAVHAATEPAPAGPRSAVHAADAPDAPVVRPRRSVDALTAGVEPRRRGKKAA